MVMGIRSIKIILQLIHKINKMKKQILKFAVVVFITNCLLPTANCFSQNIGINTTGATPDPSAALDIDMNNKGLLIPRLTPAQATTLATTAAEGLMIYNTEANCLQIFGGTTW